jgi:hypothetical protein
MNYFKALLIIFLFFPSLINAQEIIKLYHGKAPGSENWDWQEKDNLLFQ